MLRICMTSDMEMLREYLAKEVYGKPILHAVETYGFDEMFQTVYADVENGICRGVYLWIYNNLFLYCDTNQVDIDFLEQMAGIRTPNTVSGRKDNVNVVSWLLTDYTKKEQDNIPDVQDENGNIALPVRTEWNGEWSVLAGTD